MIKIKGKWDEKISTNKLNYFPLLALVNKYDAFVLLFLQ